jgi:hyperosmotically inducible protein
MKTSISTIPTLAFASILSLGCASIAFAQTPMSANGETEMKSDQPVTDSWITTKVKTELATTDGVKSTDISVKTVDGTVTLTGVVDTSIAVKKAVAVAQSVKGVKKVDAEGLKSKG